MSNIRCFVVFAALLVSLLTVTPVAYVRVAHLFFNSAPTANPDSYTIHLNGLIGPLTANDSDPDPGDTISASIVTFPTNGTLSNSGFNRFTYSRNSSTWTGTDSFTYKACDNQFPSLCSSAVTVTITVVNGAPVPGNDSYTVHGNTVIGPMKVNDTDPDGDTLTFGIQTFPAHGTITGVANPPYTSDYKSYGPNSGYTGPDSFTYRICDPFSVCSFGTVSLTVSNNPPAANADFYTVTAGTATQIGPLRENDFDPDGDTISTPSMIVAPSHGTITGVTNPDFKSYTPNAGFTGTDMWQYRITDSLGKSSDATVYITVLPSGAAWPKPPYGDCCPVDPHNPGPLPPEQGGLPAGVSDDRSSGASNGDPVNLATGRESYFSAPDLSIYNPSGPSVLWQRAYFGDQALASISGYGSPGLARGWVHNYDLRIDGTAGSWGALNLVYPNGARETLTPQLSSGTPTGSFTTTAGVPYFVTGVAGTPTGTWQSVTVTWRDQTKWKFTLLSGTTYALTQITNRMGLSLNLSWNASRALTQVADASTSTTLLTLAYDSKGRITTATDAYNRQIAYTFAVATATTPTLLQSVSQVVTAGTSSPPARYTFTYTSDKGQQLSTITVPSPTGTGNSTATINYNSIGKVTSLVDANGNQRIYTYNSGTTQVDVKNSANNLALSFTQKFNTSGLDTGSTDAASHSTTIAYNDTSNPLRPTDFTDRNGEATSVTYDSFGNVLTITTRRGLTTTYTWSYSNFALGRLTSIQQGTKPATTFTYYEPSGLLNTVTRPEPNNGAGTITSTFTYDSLGNVLTVVSPGNNATSTITTTLNYTTDGGYSQSAKIGQPLTVTDNLSHVTHMRYDSQGRPISATDADGNETDFTYNLAGQVVDTTRPATGQTGSGHSKSTNAYLYAGGPITSTTFYNESNTQVRQVTMTYGLEGEQLTVGGSTEAVTKTYDALYRPKTVKDGNNNTTTYTYNSIGRPATITLPGSEVTQFTSYDDAGNLLQRIDGNNVTTNYVYDDPEGFLTDIEYPASTSLNVHFDYDAYGRRSSMTDANGTQDYSYGNLNELLSVTTTYTGLSAQTISYSYYSNGSRESMTTPAGTFDYSYDAAGRPASMTNPFSETTTWTYRDNNWLDNQTLDNGGSATHTYNALGQITRLLNEVGASTISDFSSISYDGVGNKSSVTASVPGATSLDGTTSYTYDSLDQLTQESSTRNGGFTNNFGYDSAGNPTSFKGVTKTYNSNNQQTGTGFGYDGNGNPTTYKGSTLSFDPENRLTAYGSVLTAGYNGDGLRCWKQNASSTTHFLYDGSSPVIELDGSGSVTATNTFGANGLVSRHEGSNSVFYSFDAEGNVSQRTDGSGTVLTDNLFDAHGSVLSGTVNDPFSYKAQWGYYTDAETGLQVLTNRYYDPETGRFLTMDPIGPNGGVNLYSYVLNNPVNAVDPNGTQRDKPVPLTDAQKNEFEEAYKLAQQALADSCDCMKAVAGTSNGFIAGLRDPSGNLQRLHGSFNYGGDPLEGMSDVYAHADRQAREINLYADFFEKPALGIYANIHGRSHFPGSFIYISNPQVQAAIILHEMRHMINIGEESVHRDQKTSDKWSDDIVANCFPIKK